MKKIVAIITICIVFVMTACIGARYGWKVFGFKYCSSAEQIVLQSVKIDGDLLSLIGSTTDSTGAYVGYTYNVENNNLYIGLKYNRLLGFLKRDGEFNVKIHGNLNSIKRIIIKSKNDEKTVWIKHFPIAAK